jgi:hypothetical protein
MFLFRCKKKKKKKTHLRSSQVPHCVCIVRVVGAREIFAKNKQKKRGKKSRSSQKSENQLEKRQGAREAEDRSSGREGEGRRLF